MLHRRSPSPTNHWPANDQYPIYQSNRRLQIIWFLLVAVLALILSVAALIIVFAVEHSWFSDSYSPTNNNLNHYGLWRLCFFANQTCDSWFSTGGPFSSFIYDRLNQAKAGINAWQALEIVFLFLTASTLIIALVSCICYRLHRSIHYYLAILAVFCAWPAACIGISGLFVFGFSVFNASPAPHYLEWCFYVNIAAVVLSLLAAILLTAYAILLQSPTKANGENAGMETLTDINGYPTVYNPSTFVVVRRDKKKRKKPYSYPQTLYPQQYFPARAVKNPPASDYITNPNYQMLASYNAPIPQQASNPYDASAVHTSRSATSIPPQTRYYQPPVTAYRYSPPRWPAAEPAADYVQRGIYRPSRLNPIEPKEEPRVLHYYTGYDYFSTIDPSDVILTRHHPTYPERTSPARHSSYYPQSDYLKSAM